MRISDYVKLRGSLDSGALWGTDLIIFFPGSLFPFLQTGKKVWSLLCYAHGNENWQKCNIFRILKVIPLPCKASSSTAQRWWYFFRTHCQRGAVIGADSAHSKVNKWPNLNASHLVERFPGFQQGMFSYSQLWSAANTRFGALPNVMGHCYRLQGIVTEVTTLITGLDTCIKRRGRLRDRYKLQLVPTMSKAESEASLVKYKDLSELWIRVTPKRLLIVTLPDLIF